MHRFFLKKGFTMIEILVVIAIIGILSTLGIRSFISSQMKGRDAKRKADLANIAKPLEAYLNDHDHYPLSDAGLIIACGSEGSDGCVWGDEFVDENNTNYMVQLPEDPSEGKIYFYNTDAIGEQWALYALLENELDPKVVVGGFANTNCVESGTARLCNYRITSSNWQ